jgi:BirA family biotin operon repressor/biotin-[acetyl-CoA-carboxylase] ligase
VAGSFARQEHFAIVGSTNDVVRGWLADGTPEVCLAVADEQTAGRGRDGRSWLAPSGSALLLSLGFRPTWLAPDQVWRLAATISLAMAAAAEHVAGLPAGTIRLKWPNDLVIDRDAGLAKLAGVLGETDGLGGPDPRAVVGLGTNTDWPADAFPEDLRTTMTSLRDVAGDRPIDNGVLLEAFVHRLEPAVADLRQGRFDAQGWSARQVTTGRAVELIAPDGTIEIVRAHDVDPASGALIVEDPDAPGGRRPVVVGEIRHVRLAGPAISRAPARAGV